uniref:ARAD1A11374p n=1 Tax=Blastobotrys adeninivorans TaxID=409370 RepID=A0A060T3Q0_BLAAD
MPLYRQFPSVAVRWYSSGNGVGSSISRLVKGRVGLSGFTTRPTKFVKRRMADTNIVWVDCEMTGLDPFRDQIIEICCMITDKDLNLVDEEGYEKVIHKSKEVLDNMNEWSIEHHGKSGLTDKVLHSTNTLQEVEDGLLEYIKRYIPEKRTAVLAGNSIHQDRLFLVREFPKLIDHLHYRQIDVSSFKEILRRHHPSMVEEIPRKTASHTAKSDILESIAEMRWYRDNYLVGPGEIKAKATDKVKS